MKIEINVTGIDWKEVVEAIKGATTTSAVATKKKVTRKAAPKKEAPKQEETPKQENPMDFMDIPLGGETQTTQTTQEIVNEFSQYIVGLTRAGKHTDSAIRNAVSNVQQEDPFKSLGVRVKDMEPAMAKQFVDRVKTILN